jgi:hypothetical protein
VVEQNWSLERFCLSPELRNFYSQFLWCFPISRFSFIGVFEAYEEDFLYFAENFLNAQPSFHSKNINPDKGNEPYIKDNRFRRQIESYHDKDMALYQLVLKMRTHRLPK